MTMTRLPVDGKQRQGGWKREMKAEVRGSATIGLGQDYTEEDWSAFTSWIFISRNSQLCNIKFGNFQHFSIKM
jgi:hypothetical protein